MLKTEEEDKNVIHHDTQSNEVSDKIRLENEIKELNEKLKMYKAKIPKPPIQILNRTSLTRKTSISVKMTTMWAKPLKWTRIMKTVWKKNQRLAARRKRINKH